MADKKTIRIKLNDHLSMINHTMIKDWFSLMATILYSKISEYYNVFDILFSEWDNILEPLSISYKELSELIWCTKSKVIRWIKELINKWLIYVNKWNKNIYFVTDINRYPSKWLF